MISETLTDEQRAFVEAIRDFAKRECGTREQRDALTDHGNDPHNQALYERIAELGWLGASIPEQYGGSGGGAVELCLLCEEFARGLIPMGFYSVSMITAGAYQRFGTEAQKHEILGGIAAGAVESIAMSEPDSGSDVGSLTCKAERRNGGYVINGQKTWITGAHKAEHILLVCRTHRGENKHEGLTMLSVPTDVDGVEIRAIDTMGGREVNDIFFTDCNVPEDRLLGTQDHAWMQLMAGLNHERLIIAAQLLGIAERAFEDLVARELTQLTAAIPHAELAIQWDLAYETQDIEGVLAWTPEGGWERFAGPVTRLTRAKPLVPVTSQRSSLV